MTIRRKVIALQVIRVETGSHQENVRPGIQLKIQISFASHGDADGSRR